MTVFHVYQFAEQTQLEFAGTTTSFAPNTLKISIEISRWPFLALANSLAIVLDSSGTTNTQNGCTKSQVNDNGDLQWILVVMGELSLYPPTSGGKSKESQNLKNNAERRGV